MKRIYLYEGRGKHQRVTENFVIVDEDNYEHLNQWKWFKMSIYHTDNKIYYARRYEGLTNDRTFKAILMHRVILGLTKKQDKGDHIDGNGLNNQKSNLRKCTHSQNLSNRRSHTKHKTSRYHGVSKHGNRWVYIVSHNRSKFSKGGFISEDVAALEYNKKTLELKGDFAKLNTIRWY